MANPMSRAALVVDPSAAPKMAMSLERGTTIQLLGTGQGVRNVDMHVNQLLPGRANGPLHRHERAENIHVVLQGTVLLRIDGHAVRLEQGSVAFIPPGIVHGVTNPAQETAVLLEIYSPPGGDYVVVGTDVHDDQGEWNG